MNTKVMKASAITMAVGLLVFAVAEMQLPGANITTGLLTGDTLKVLPMILIFMPLCLFIGLVYPPMFLYGIASIAVYGGLITGLVGLSLESTPKSPKKS